MSLAGLPVTLSADIQSLNPGALLVLYVLDFTNVSGGSIDYFHACTNELKSSVVWQGNIYTPYPVKIEGMAFTTQGAMPRPKAMIANPGGVVSALLRQYNDLRGAKVTCKKVLAKYLDNINFTGGVNPSGVANPAAGFEDEIYYVERKETEDNEVVVLELCASADMEGTEVPLRFIQGNICGFIYRGGECPYSGGAVAIWDDTATSNINLDVCGKRISSCKLRFPNQTLPFGGFPGSGRIQ